LTIFCEVLRSNNSNINQLPAAHFFKLKIWPAILFTNLLVVKMIPDKHLREAFLLR